MIGFETSNLLPVVIWRLVFTFLVPACVAFIAILKNYCCGGINLLKARWFYILMTFIFVISVTSIERSSLSVISCDKRVTTNITDSSVLHIESDSYLLKNGIIGAVIENSTLTSSNRSSNIFE